MKSQNFDFKTPHDHAKPFNFDIDQFTSSEADIKQEFSFNREIKKNNQHSLQEKYFDIYKDLKNMNCDDLIELLLEELDENERYKHQVSFTSNRIDGLEQELSQFKDELKKKREAIELLCETESKHLQLIEKLENKISKRGEYGRDTHYEKKYQELSVYMSEYIRNINLAQDEFKRVYSTLKAENTRLIKQIEELNSECTQMANRVQIQSQKGKRIEQEVVELNQNKKKLCKEIGILSDENEILRKEIEVYQENIRITDRLEAHFSHENNQLSSDLDFIREKICENQSISKDIIEKFEENSSINFEKVNKVKELVLDSLQNFQSKNIGLEKEIESLKKENLYYKKKADKLEKESEELLEEKKYLNEDLEQQKVEKEGIKRELIGLSDKVKVMEATYRKEAQQNEKIKGELFKFWENKEKKEVKVKEISPRALRETKMNNCEYSRSTLSNSQKEEKMSTWEKKSFHESSSNISEKENRRDMSESSLCN